MDPLLHFRLWALLSLPDTAVAIASAGLCLIFVEFNRPGSVLPGMFGALLILLEAAHLLRLGLRPSAAVLLLTCSLLLLANLERKLPLWPSVAATLGAVAGIRFLIVPQSPRQVHTPTAIVCGGCLGTLTALLTRVAYRARRAKALD